MKINKLNRRFSLVYRLYYISNEPQSTGLHISLTNFKSQKPGYNKSCIIAKVNKM
jgi:hypothetical protein